MGACRRRLGIATRNRNEGISDRLAGRGFPFSRRVFPTGKPTTSPAGNEFMKSIPTAEDKRHAERLWQLYQLAFQRLADRHTCLPPHLYGAAGTREWESAQAIARAMTLAVAAAAKWEAYEQRIQQLNKEL